MGIRVDKEAIINQAILSSNEDKLNLEYQQKIINEEVPFTLGGGIGQSRLCMFFLNKLHVGEVQSSYWDESTREFFLSKGITLLQNYICLFFMFLLFNYILYYFIY